jgi:hypothetical protein
MRVLGVLFLREQPGPFLPGVIDSRWGAARSGTGGPPPLGANRDPARPPGATVNRNRSLGSHLPRFRRGGDDRSTYGPYIDIFWLSCLSLISPLRYRRRSSGSITNTSPDCQNTR